MPNDLEKLIKLVYRKHKSGSPIPKEHPDEETMACFVEGKLSPAEEQNIRRHLVECSLCAEVFLAQINLDISSAPEISDDLIIKTKSLFPQAKIIPVLEVLLQLKEGLMDLLATNGDVLVGQELIPAPVLRSRQIKGFKDEVLILKDFAGIRVEMKVEKRGGSAFGLSVSVRDKQNLRVIKDLRITLLKGDTELESYINDSGKVVFEHVTLGKYTVEIADLKEKLAAILLDIKT
ncbi:MAG: hypothetical protein WC532_06860 [Candidatus Omnitrophota bacterium]